MYRTLANGVLILQNNPLAVKLSPIYSLAAFRYDISRQPARTRAKQSTFSALSQFAWPFDIGVFQKYSL